MIRGSLALLLAALAFATPAHAEFAPVNSDATLSMNMTSVADYSPSYPFMDLMRVAAQFSASSKWNAKEKDKVSLDRAALGKGGYLDADGWPVRIPEGAAKIEALWRLGSSTQNERYRLAGRYHLRYDGTGKINMKGGKTISSRPGHIVFDTEAKGLMAIQITEIDPDDHVRNITFVHERNLARFDAGEIFDPPWFDLIDDLATIRFMDWMKTNNSGLRTWDQMPPVNGPNTGRVPIEIMVRLANETGANPWFTMPWDADENFNRKFAEYVRDNLNPELRVHVEYSNENWNAAFRHNWRLADEAKAAWGDKYVGDWYVKRATETALIWEDVFRDAPNRLVNVLGAQTANSWLSGRLMNPIEWQKHDPDSYVEPASVFDALGVTTYWGGAMVTDEPLRDEMLAVLADPTRDAESWVTQKQMAKDYKHSVRHSERMLKDQAAIAKQFGLRLLAYEGGQHMHHSFAVKSLTDEQITRITRFMRDYVRSEGMAELYQASWDAWRKHGDGPYMQFADVTASSKWGMWGLWEHTRDSSPRSELLVRLNEEVDPWWDDAAQKAGAPRN